MADTRSAAEKELSRIERRVQNRGGNIKFTPEAIQRLNTLEAKLQARSTTNKNLKIAFGETINFFSELNKLTPEERSAKLRSIRQAAEDEFAGYFAGKREDLSEDFNTQLDRLNRDFKFANEDTLEALKTRMAGLDRDTVAAIGSAFRSVINRGLGNSGALKSLADKIVQQRKIAADQVQDLTERSIRDTRTRFSDRQQDLNVAKERGDEEINQTELFNVKLEEQRLQDRESQILLQSNDLTGQNTLAPREVDEPATPEVDANDPLSVRLANIGGTDTSEPSVTDIERRVSERRNNRLARLNLAL